LKKQNKMLWDIRDKLSSAKPSELKEILDFNSHDSSGSVAKLIERVADCMLFGVPSKCPVCKKGYLNRNKCSNYTCNGFISDWSR